ncbi:MAG TPA: glycerophosphodiester phosphodiesterase [Roseiflexaceae bacterium]|nr:glycerophosphodiester phosphodiesterase [Roseiflexaceae bacterium]
MPADPLYQALLAESGDSADRALAARYAPSLLFDRQEPFLPLAAGYTIFRSDAPSPSFPRQVLLCAPDRPAAQLVIEYAIWWDWDIQHLYELEHVWVSVDADGRVVHADASWHGGMHPMLHDGALRLEGDHVVVYSEPGKHAFAPDPAWFAQRATHPRGATEALAGLGGVLVTSLFKGQIARTPLADTLARTYLARHAFRPAMSFDQRFAFTPAQLVPWAALRDWVPGRVAWWVARLADEIAPAEYRPLRVGHRGAAAHAPDNSLAGIEAAARLGADAVEIDVQLTRDGTAVAVHDLALHAEDGSARMIAESTFEQLRALPAGARLATLDEVLLCCQANRIGLYLELKAAAAIPLTLETLRKHNFDELIVGSFRPDWLADVKAAAPELPTSVLFGAPTTDACALAAAAHADYVHPCWEARADRPDELLTAEWVAQVRAAGLGIVCWHEERPPVIDGIHQRGVDAICSDRPELLVKGKQLEPV